MECKILGILKKNCFHAVSTEGDNLIVVTEGDIENITIDIEKEMEAFAEWCSKNKWYAFGQEEHMWYNYTKQITKTTAQLRELWEKGGRND